MLTFFQFSKKFFSVFRNINDVGPLVKLLAGWIILLIHLFFKLVFCSSGKARFL